jgi:hypothetical protein
MIKKILYYIRFKIISFFTTKKEKYSMKILKNALFLSFALIVLFYLPALSSPEDSAKRVFYYADGDSGMPDSAVAFIKGVRVADAKVLLIVEPEKCRWGTKAVFIRETHYDKDGKKILIVIAGIGKYALYDVCPDNECVFFKKWPDKTIDELTANNKTECSY